MLLSCVVAPSCIAPSGCSQSPCRRPGSTCCDAADLVIGSRVLAAPSKVVTSSGRVVTSAGALFGGADGAPLARFGGAGSGRHDHHDAAIVLTPHGRRVARQGIGLAAAHDLVGRERHAACAHRLGDGLGACLGELEVVRLGPCRIAMSFDPGSGDTYRYQMACELRDALALARLQPAFVDRKEEPFIERQFPALIGLDKALRLQRRDLLPGEGGGVRHALTGRKKSGEEGQKKRAKPGAGLGHGISSHQERWLSLSSYMAASAAVSNAAASWPSSG